VDKGQTIVSIVGNEIASHPDTLKKVFESLQNIDVRMVSYGGSAHNISILVQSGDKTGVLQGLNSGLFGL
jgi:aspartate kinase